MKYMKFIKEAEQLAASMDKEESAVILLLEYVTKENSTGLYTKLHEEVSKEIQESFQSLFHRYLYENEPVQYLIGSSCFYGYDFKVTKDVLIPRYETEELVEQVLYRYDSYFKGQQVDVCDLATGSGCIGITLALEEKLMRVVATDISKDALRIAKENSEKLGANVEFLEGDMLEPVKNRKFDIFVSNPPYIPEKENVMSLVKDNEPNIALFGGEDGMKFYRIILENVHTLLKEKAIVCFEHGYDKKEEMLALAKHYFPEARVEVLKDLEGKDRMTFIYVGDFNV
ncbi:MAG: peptide chain release factor N(5)-glutamine methyltransferase [Acholeplasmatales bacterium]|jgi:release factor glutamine methyltransferase|nr:peptide chain release factor N(5)-glutamine methyltransferase [Acholeplasmatales bacterium]